jgi:hypothetical protein
MSPGWYPWDAGQMRYFDGGQWGAKRERVGREVPHTQARKRRGGWLVRSGYVAAVLFPALGLVLGIIVATRPGEGRSVRRGIQIILLAVAIAGVSLALRSR